VAVASPVLTATAKIVDAPTAKNNANMKPKQKKKLPYFYNDNKYFDKYFKQA